jgi:Tol biopolymer transport system component
MKPKCRRAIAFMQSLPRVAAYSIALALLLFASCTAPLSAFSQSDPVIFSPGVVPTNAPSSAAPAFTPDGNTVYFGESPGGSDISIVVSHLIRGGWSVPQTAPFSGKYRDLEPTFIPSGKYLIFASSRPVTPKGAALDGHYDGQVHPGSGGNLWKVERTAKGWKNPEHLPLTINSNSSVFSPAVATDGSLYFMRADNGGSFHIYRSQIKHGKFQPPALASFSETDHGDYDPAVAPDESYVIFCSGRPPAPPHTTDLFIVFRTPQGWSEPIDLRSAISQNVYGIEARLSPDGKTLYFSNSRNALGEIVKGGRYIWKVDLTSLLKAHSIG